MLVKQLKKRWSSLQKGKIGCAMFLFNNARGGGWPCSLHRQIVIIKSLKKLEMGSKKRKKKPSVKQGQFDYFEIFKCSGPVGFIEF